MNNNILFQGIWGTLDVIAIVVSFISLALSMIAFLRGSTAVQKQEKRYRLKKLWSIRYGVFHAIVLFCLTIYVLTNWEKCISMQFLSQFDGNNILFLVWIVLIFFLIYEVEGKGVRVAQRKQEETQKSLSEAELKYQLDAMLEQIENGTPNDNTYQKKQGDSENGL